jgi:GABA(A) receptor-associated protein
MSYKPYYFKDKYCFEERFDEVQRIKKRYPDHIPVICEKDINDRTKYGLNASIDSSCDKGATLLHDDFRFRGENHLKCKYLLNPNMTIGEFIYIIRTKIKLSPEKGLYFFINGVIPAMNEMMCTIYRSHKSNDGFLYMRYTSENTFGF